MTLLLFPCCFSFSLQTNSSPRTGPGQLLTLQLLPLCVEEGQARPFVVAQTNDAAKLPDSSTSFTEASFNLVGIRSSAPFVCQAPGDADGRHGHSVSH